MDLRAIIDPEAAARSGVAHAEALVAFADALVGGDDEQLAAARRRLLEALGPAGFVNAAAVASNFQRMVRIADATGISLDAPVEAVTGDLREMLDLARFGSAANTRPKGPVRRALGRVLQPLAPVMMRIMARQMARSSRPPR